MELDFIDRSLKTSGVVLLVFLPFGLFYLGTFPSLAIFFGGVWGILNLIFISALVRSTLRPGGANRPKAVGVALFKFPLLYAAGFFLLKVPQFEPLYLLIGFSSLFVIIVLKALGRMISHADDSEVSNAAQEGLSDPGAS